MLAIKRADNGEWVLPGGIVELDEDPRDTVRREVLEETGVTVEPGQLTGVYKNMRLGVVSLVFRCHPLSGTAVSRSFKTGGLRHGAGCTGETWCGESTENRAKLRYDMRSSYGSVSFLELRRGPVCHLSC